MAPELVLASTSSYRAAVLRDAGIPFRAVAPLVDERAFDDRFDELGPEGYASAIASAKAGAVAAQELAQGPGEVMVVGLDQIAVLSTPGGPRLLHQPGTPERAVEQLMAMSGSTHQLINAVVAIDPFDGERFIEIDTHHVTMRTFSEAEATEYVKRFAPLDCAGSYRIEDDADLLAHVEGEDESGVIGLPLPTLRRLMAAVSGRSR